MRGGLWPIPLFDLRFLVSLTDKAVKVEERQEPASCQEERGLFLDIKEMLDKEVVVRDPPEDARGKQGYSVDLRQAPFDAILVRA